MTTTKRLVLVAAVISLLLRTVCSKGFSGRRDRRPLRRLRVSPARLVIHRGYPERPDCFQQAYGLASVENGIPAQPSTKLSTCLYHQAVHRNSCTHAG